MNVYAIEYVQDLQKIESLDEFRPGLLHCEVGAPDLMSAKVIFYMHHNSEKVKLISINIKRKGEKR